MPYLRSCSRLGRQLDALAHSHVICDKASLLEKVRDEASINGLLRTSNEPTVNGKPTVQHIMVCGKLLFNIQ